MNENLYRAALIFVALLFTGIFIYLVILNLIPEFDVVGAAMSGFVNPYSSAYAWDAICCWMVLFLWVIYESPRVKGGWICLLLGLVPGVAVGFALYLIMRTKQLVKA